MEGLKKFFAETDEKFYVLVSRDTRYISYAAALDEQEDAGLKMEVSRDTRYISYAAALDEQEDAG